MRVKIYDIDSNTGEQTLRGEDATLAMFDDDDDRHWVEHELRSRGRSYVGGGAAPLVLLVRAGDAQ
jgi:hypothetical protein